MTILIQRCICIALISFMAAACSGPGGDDGGGGGDPVLTPASDTVTFDLNWADDRASQSLNVRINSGRLTATVVGGSPAWLDVVPGSSVNGGTVSLGFQVIPRETEVGTQSVQVELRNGTLSRTITVIANVTDSFNLPGPQPFGTYGRNADIAADGMQLYNFNTEWRITIDQDWVQPDVTTGQGSYTFDLTYDTAALPVGAHFANIRVESSDGSMTHDSIIRFTQERNPNIGGDIDPFLFVTANTSREIEAEEHWVAVGGLSGLPVSLELPEGVTTVPAPETILMQTPFRFVYDPEAEIAPGTYDLSVTFTSDAGNQDATLTLPLTLTVEPERLYTADNGVAFLDTPTAPAKPRSFVFGKYTVPDGDITVTSAPSWVSVTWLDETTAVVDVVTDGLGAELTTVEGSIVFSTPTSDGTTTETVQVSLVYDPNNDFAEANLGSIGSDDQLLVNPVKRVAYTWDTGTDGIQLIPIYSGAASSIAFSGVESLTVSYDGQTLYALNSLGEIWSMNSDGTNQTRMVESVVLLSDIRFMRPEGENIIATLYSQFFRSDGTNANGSVDVTQRSPYDGLATLDNDRTLVTIGSNAFGLYAHDFNYSFYSDVELDNFDSMTTTSLGTQTLHFASLNNTGESRLLFLGNREDFLFDTVGRSIVGEYELSEDYTSGAFLRDGRYVLLNDGLEVHAEDDASSETIDLVTPGVYLGTAGDAYTSLLIEGTAETDKQLVRRTHD